jgi:hypothetical protein
MAEVRGAGSERSDGDNPRVTSKFDRDGGKPRTPGKVEHPGGTAPITGTKVRGHTEHGHQIPREVDCCNTDRIEGDAKKARQPRSALDHAS